MLAIRLLNSGEPIPGFPCPVSWGRGGWTWPVTSPGTFLICNITAREPLSPDRTKPLCPSARRPPAAHSPAHCPAVSRARQKQALFSQCGASCPANVAPSAGCYSAVSLNMAQGSLMEIISSKRGCFFSSFQAGADSSILEGAHLTGH